MIDVKFFDADFRRQPKTSINCAYCQRDLNSQQIKYLAWLSFENGPQIFNPKTVWKMKHDFDLGLHPIGCECAKHIGKEWLLEIKFQDCVEGEQ